jgi:hypothetical protein
MWLVSIITQLQYRYRVSKHIHHWNSGCHVSSRTVSPIPLDNYFLDTLKQTPKQSQRQVITKTECPWTLHCNSCWFYSPTMKMLKLSLCTLLQLHTFPVHIQIVAGMHKFREPVRLKFPTVALSIRGLWVWKMLRITILGPLTVRWRSDL